MVRQGNERKVDLSIDGERKIPAIDVINAIQHLQNILYHFGDYHHGTPSRSSGDFPQIVKESCTLLFANVEMGSVHVELEIGDAQVGLTGIGTLGERAVCSSQLLLDAISKTGTSKEELYDIVNDPHRVNKILKEFYQMWPESGSSRSISIGFCGDDARVLDPAQKKSIKRLIHKPIDEYQKEVFGWVFDIRVDENKRIMLASPEGPVQCIYDPEIEDDVISHLREFVKIRGTMKLHKGKFMLFVDDEDCIKRTSTYALTDMGIDNVNKKLDTPVPLELEVEDYFYIASNDEIGILGYQKSVEKAVNEAKEQLFVLFKEYVLTSEELSKSGEELSEKLKSIVGDCRGFI